MGRISATARKEIVSAVGERYYAPATPAARLLASADIADSAKQRLRAVAGTLDPLRLLDEIRAVQHHIAGLAAGELVHALPHRDADLDVFIKSLATAWQAGEVRPTHRTGPKPPRHWRTRQDPLQAVWPRVVAWLETEPERTAQELLARLAAEDSSVGRAQLRTLQRRIKQWRALMARRLLLVSHVQPRDVSSTKADRDALSVGFG